MDGTAIIGTQVGVGLGLIITLGIPLLKLSSKWGKAEQSMEDVKEDIQKIEKHINNKPCDDNSARIAKIEGFIEGRNSMKEQ